MKFKYYEEIAAAIFEIQPQEIFLRSRETPYKLSRFFCMKYRHEYLGLSLATSAKRYNRDHATAINAIKRVDQYIETKDDYGIMYFDFLSKCDKAMEILKVADIKDIQKDVKAKIETMGWSEYIGNMKEQFMAMFNDAKNNDNEKSVRKQIMACTESIKELKLLYHE